VFPDDSSAWIRDISEQVLSDDWRVLRKASFELRSRDGSWKRQERESYDRGNGAVILLHDPGREKVLMTRQFRWPAYTNGHPDGMLIEACAGVVDEGDPETAIRREAREEIGIEVGAVTRLFTAYMSPGSVTELLYFYYATYDETQPRGQGGGVAAEGEEIELVELTVEEALSMLDSGAILDAKTIMLLQWLAIERSDA
jgi:nudix-type nucleoside diphosphatase (YffH/AdpP family)